MSQVDFNIYLKSHDHCADEKMKQLTYLHFTRCERRFQHQAAPVEEPFLFITSMRRKTFTFSLFLLFYNCALNCLEMSFINKESSNQSHHMQKCSANSLVMEVGGGGQVCVNTYAI